MAAPQVRRFLSTLLYQASHGIYYGRFYSIYLHQHGYAASVIGLMDLRVAADRFYFGGFPRCCRI